MNHETCLGAPPARLAADPASERREYKRCSVSWTGKLSWGGETVRCDLVDISAGGARVQLARPVHHRSPVTLTIDQIGEFPGEIAWNGGYCMAIRFLDDLDTANSANEEPADLAMAR